MFFIFICVLSEDDRERIEQLFKENHVMLYHISYKLLQSDSDAQDAVAQAFLNLMEHFEKINHLPGPQMAPYCVVIVKNASYDILRKKKKNVPLDAAEIIEDDAPDVEELVLKTADTEQLLSAMKKLPDADRYLMELRYVKDMGFKEIAKLMGVSEDAAKKRGQRVLKKLKSLYEEGDENG